MGAIVEDSPQRPLLLGLPSTSPRSALFNPLFGWESSPAKGYPYSNLLEDLAVPRGFWAWSKQQMQVAGGGGWWVGTSDKVCLVIVFQGTEVLVLGRHQQLAHPCDFVLFWKKERSCPPILSWGMARFPWTNLKQQALVRSAAKRRLNQPVYE